MEQMYSSLDSIDIKTDYRTDRDDAIKSFYTPCLEASNHYFRAVGYFRSSIFVLTGESTISFVKKGGVIDLICSPSLTREDAEAIEKGQETIEKLSIENLQEEIDALLRNSDKDYSVIMLATLVKVGALRIKIALLEEATGIYHEKLGIFEDTNGNRVSFIGSSNETLNAWHKNGNFESIEVFCSWNGHRESSRVQRHIEDFKSLWEGTSKGIRTLDLPNALKNQLVSIAEKDIEEIYTKKYLKNSKNTKDKLKIDNLLPHQSMAIDLWEKNNYRGILKHATGSGKTVTALAALNKHLTLGLPAIILVPSRLLLEQWTKELSMEISDSVMILAGAGHVSWKKNGSIRNFLYGESPGQKRVVIATMQTASTKEFLTQVINAKNIMLVVDECHQFGSPQNSVAMEIKAIKRLGLSATPERFGDIDGTNILYEYFGRVLEPEISLYDAIQAGRLVEYEYFPKIVNLTVQESEDWTKLSKEINREIAIASSDESHIKLTNKAKMLLIERARIAKKSVTKYDVVKKVILENYKIGDSWLIYCEDQTQLKDVSAIIKNLGFSPLEYYSSMDGSSVETLKLFQLQGGILVSIRCLDEGIDIPSISHALILASSQNPRQFIQRRGRVLRKHSSKIFAKIFDVIVLPVSLDTEPEQFSLMKSELTRAYEFSKHALNLSSGDDLKLAASKLGIDLNDIVNVGIEEEFDDAE